ncbi:hypothetical protein [Celeribacter sp. PS-C1]|uniref:hypothetical protein n=1 Tax=Celeribacter sp. PS-C1 TaxID=2820813 RepID=UPI001CA56261|nr:hypothetical protein [Celeribacter sp. PS-C1]MBW6419687.1 hypothetical protein [Celeribacter sp. PS-C1]
MDWTRTIVLVVLLAAAYWLTDHFLDLKSKTKTKRFLILLPVIFIVIVVFGQIWPAAA